jgi:hypothetical protein
VPPEGDTGRLGAAVQCRSGHHIEARGINARNIAKQDKSGGSDDPISRSSGESHDFQRAERTTHDDFEEGEPETADPDIRDLTRRRAFLQR